MFKNNSKLNFPNQLNTFCFYILGSNFFFIFKVFKKFFLKQFIIFLHMKPPVFSLLSSRVTNNGSLYGRFLIGPLPIDISLTLATILRRSLLHSKAAFTIASVKIEGVNHEYASLPGINESVLEILLNLGEIVLTSKNRNLFNPNLNSSFKERLLGTSGSLIAFLRTSGPSVITAKDIQWPNGIQCVKPNAYIATLSSNATLAMRIKINFVLTKKHSLSNNLESNPLLETNLIAQSSKLLSQMDPVTKSKAKDENLSTTEKSKANEHINTLNPSLNLKTSRSVLPKWAKTHFVQNKSKDVLKENGSKTSASKPMEPNFIKSSTLEPELVVSSTIYPVEKVNFLIERDDQYGGYRHRIIFEVWTNGSISPRQAIFDGISWIIKLLYNFREPIGSNLFSIS